MWHKIIRCSQTQTGQEYELVIIYSLKHIIKNTMQNKKIYSRKKYIQIVNKLQVYIYITGITTTQKKTRNTCNVNTFRQLKQYIPSKASNIMKTS